MSPELNFEPLTSQLGISGTSFRLQLGLINGKWAARILKGRDIIDSYVFKDEDITESGAPNQNIIVGYVLRTVTIPNINPYGIMKTTQALVKQALANKDKKKVVAPLEETKKVELEKVDESQLKRPKAQGWVKEEVESSKALSEEEKRALFQAKLKAKKAAEAESAGSKVSTEKKAVAEVKTVKTTRTLPSIPSAESPEVSNLEAEPESQVSASSVSTTVERDLFCPYCGKDLNWKYCPYCGKPLPHAHEK
ncbi:MAG: zinc ribbon domain-containing protein [Promethearchaeota archaeon]